MLSRRLEVKSGESALRPWFVVSLVSPLTDVVGVKKKAAVIAGGGDQTPP